MFSVFMMSTGPPGQDQYTFVQTSFYLELHVYRNKLKNLNRTSKFKCSFRGLGFDDLIQLFPFIALA